MRLETPFVALMIGSLFFVGFFTVFLSSAEHYNVDYDLGTYQSQNNDTSLIDAFNRINETKTDMDKANQEFEDTLFLEDNSLFPFFNLALKIGRNIFQSLTMFKDLMNITAEIFGIPSTFVVTLFAILITIFALVVIFILLGRAV